MISPSEYLLFVSGPIELSAECEQPTLSTPKSMGESITQGKTKYQRILLTRGTSALIVVFKRTGKLASNWGASFRAFAALPMDGKQRLFVVRDLDPRSRVETAIRLGIVSLWTGGTET